MADIAIFRINYKSDFILTLQSDAGWLTPFCIKFWTGAPSQAYFAGYDGTTYTHCAPVDGDHTKLSVQFDDHHLPIGDLKFQIGYHFTVADFPTSIEDEVINQAAVIIDNDGEQQQVMLDFNGETAPDIAFSLPAYANEAQRIANEQVRIAAEEQRVSNEQQRISNEEGRISAEERRQEHEQQRIHNEETRIAEFARLEADAIAATGAANDAATLANEKAQLASDKAALAQSAATLASDKAQLAADKAALAQAAATLANDKAALAQQKADYAQAKGDYAQAQGDYAKAQSDIALADHERAETDHERAEADHDTATDDHTTATSDHTQAESDHTRAEADHTTAASDHTQASSDHSTATSDHTQAGQDHTRAESDHTTAAADHTRAESDHAAVEAYVDSLGAFDISAYHATGSVLAKYADLTAALGTNGANIPDELRKGGMSVKFVLSSDNKYVQYRYMGTDVTGTPNPFLDTANWQGVTNEVKAGSKDLVESGGVALLTKGGNVYNNLTNIDLSSLNLFNGAFRGNNLYSAGKSYIIPVSTLSYSNLVVTSDGDNCWIGYSHDAVEHVSSTTPIAQTNLLKIEQVGNGTKIFTVPSEIDGQTIEYVYIVRNASSTIYNVNANEFSSMERYGGINIINLSKNGEVYATKADARNLVPDDMKFKGLELKYLMAEGWVDEYFVGSEWSTEDSAWSPNVVIDNSFSLGSSNPVANKTIAKEFGNVVVAEGSGTSSTAVTVDYIPWTNLEYTLPAGTKLNIEVGGVGEGNPVRTLRMYFNDSNSPKIYIHDSKTIITLDEDVTKIRVASAAIETSYEGNISISINYIGTTIRKLEESIDTVNRRIDKLNGSYDFDVETVVDKFATDKENNEFTNSFTFSINSYGHAHKNMIINAYAMFINNVDDAVPTIQFIYKYGSTTVYTSTAYTIGKKDEYCQREWRVPAFMDNCSVQVIVTIPSNVTLYISEFTNYYSDTINRNAVGYRMNAHLSFYNFNTYNAWTESAKLGYPCAIVVPKRTSDGVWVCFHDDSLSDQLIDANGRTPADNHPGETLTISSLTYSELQTYTYKENKFGEYLKVAKLEDFFMVCAKTGMHPMFSWHPVSSAEEMQDVKAMAKKFGILPYLNIKMAFSGGSSVSALDRAYSVFGSEIESYTGDVNVDTDISTIITALDTTNAAQNKDKVRVGLELFNSRLGNDTSKVQAILDAGYFAAIAWMTADPTGEQLEYWIRNGVTEFTEYDMFSYGLNW